MFWHTFCTLAQALVKPSDQQQPHFRKLDPQLLKGLSN